MPVPGFAKEVAALRVDRPGYQFTIADMESDIRIAFAVATAHTLGPLTGITSAEQSRRGR